MSVIFHSRGASPHEVLEIMKGLGWKPVYGGYDFAFEWDRDLGKEKDSFQEYCEHIDIVHNRLENLNVSYTLKTFERGKEDAQALNVK